MEWNHCGHLGFPIDTILASFDPEVILLLGGKFRLKETKGLGRDVEIDFYLEFSIGSLANLCLLSSLMLITKF